MLTDGDSGARSFTGWRLPGVWGWPRREAKVARIDPADRGPGAGTGIAPAEMGM